MNYFKVGGRQYRAEIRGGTNPVTGAPCFGVDIDIFDERGGILPRVRLARDTRPAARRALKKEIERLAIGPDGKRANWTITRSARRAASARVAAAAALLRLAVYAERTWRATRSEGSPLVSPEVIAALVARAPAVVHA